MLVWNDCGYISFTKNHKRVLVVLKHKRYVVSLEELKDVLDDKKNYTLIFEPPSEDKVDDKASDKANDNVDDKVLAS